MVISAPVSVSGANALAVAPARDFAPVSEKSLGTAPAQPALFPVAGPKVIPFDELQRHVNARTPALFIATPPKTGAPAKGPAKRPVHHSPEQTSIDFVPSPGASARTLKTAVPALIYCDHPVATPIHRFVAGAMDTAMILLGFGLFVGVAQLLGASFGQGKLFWAILGIAFALISFFYSLLWTLYGRETAGMCWTELQLVTFDGFAVDRRTRVIRTVSAWLSFCAGGIGVLWALVDEEKLAWHDHISKTFPTPREVDSSFHRQRH